MLSLSSDPIFRPLLHNWTRRVVVVASAAMTGRVLVSDGWPWWAWLPAAILAGMAGYLLMILLSYAYQKCTYPIRARLIKEQLRQSAASQSDAATGRTKLPAKQYALPPPPEDGQKGQARIRPDK